MGRPRSFNEQELLDLVIGFFRANSYQAATVREILGHIGLNRSSLYNAFSDKRALLLMALHRESELRLLAYQQLSTLQADFGASLAAFLQQEANRLETDRGDLLVQISAELGLRDAEIAQLVAHFRMEQEESLCVVIAKAQQRGEWVSRPDARQQAKQLLDSLVGWAIAARATSNPMLTSRVETLLHLMKRG